MAHRTSLNAGFTLLELMVALVLFALVGIAAHRMLQTAIAAQEKGQIHAQALTQLQKTMMLLTQDIVQSDPTSFSSGDGYALSFERRGWSNPLQLPRSDGLRVSYAVREGTLRRYYWPVARRDDAPQQQMLLDGVADFRFRTAPRMVEITLNTKAYGVIRRVVEVPDV